MKIFLKVAIAYFVLFFGVLAFSKWFSEEKKQKVASEFVLMDHVSESDVVYRCDFSIVLKDAIQFNSQVLESIPNHIALNKIKSEITKAGLGLKNSFICYQHYPKNYYSIYWKIVAPEQFEKAMKKFASTLNLEQIKNNPTQYLSKNDFFSVQIYGEYVQLNIGNGAVEALVDKQRRLSQEAKELLNKVGTGIIKIDTNALSEKVNYASFNYDLTKDFQLTAEWWLPKTIEMRRQENEDLAVYDTKKDQLIINSNINLNHVSSLLPFWVNSAIEKELTQLPDVFQLIFKDWNGIASFRWGEKTTKKTVKYITEFDENFNSIEKEVVQIDSIPDFGIYWGSYAPNKTLENLNSLPHVQLEDKFLQLPLLPALELSQTPNALKIGTKSNFRKEKSSDLLFIKTDFLGFASQLKLTQVKQNLIHLKIKIKDLYQLNKLQEKELIKAL